MTKTICIMLVSLLASGLCTAPFSIAAPAKQNKMAACNAQANDKGLGEGTGEQREAFIKECLSAKPTKVGGTQQNKMKTCNKQSAEKGLKGDERKKFMRICLSN